MPHHWSASSDYGDGNGDNTTPLSETAANYLIVGGEVIDGVKHYAAVGKPNLIRKLASNRID